MTIAARERLPSLAVSSDRVRHQQKEPAVVVDVANREPHRLRSIGPARAIAYAVLVGCAAYLVASVYGPASIGPRLVVTAGITTGYVLLASVVVRYRPAQL